MPSSSGVPESPRNAIAAPAPPLPGSAIISNTRVATRGRSIVAYDDQDGVLAADSDVGELKYTFQNELIRESVDDLGRPEAPRKVRLRVAGGRGDAM